MEDCNNNNGGRCRDASLLTVIRHVNVFSAAHYREEYTSFLGYSKRKRPRNSSSSLSPAPSFDCIRFMILPSQTGCGIEA